MCRLPQTLPRDPPLPKHVPKARTHSSEVLTNSSYQWMHHRHLMELETELPSCPQWDCPWCKLHQYLCREFRTTRRCHSSKPNPLPTQLSRPCNHHRLHNGVDL